jgi:pilus assembly protein CpaC
MACAVFLVTPGLGWAQNPPVVRALSLIAGKGELLQFDREVTKVVIAEPRIADAIVVSPHDVMVNAKGPGHTTLVIWQGEAATSQYDISVSVDTTEADFFHRLIGDELKAAVPGADIQFSGTPESIVLTGKVTSAEQSQRAEAVASTHSRKVVNLLQAPQPRQILLQVKFASVDRTHLAQIGVNLLSNNPKMLGATSTQQFQQPLFSPLQFQNGNLTGPSLNISNLLNIFLYRPDLNIGATIQALEQQNLLQILAEPNLIVEDGAEASFLAGGEFPYPTITSTPTTGGIAPVVTVQFRKFGVQLNFTPKLSPDGSINLKVKPEVSALDFNNAITIEGVQIPAISSRVAETQVVLKEGESFAIAGLIDNRVTKVLNKIKGIGDVPILGYLFRSHSTQKTTNELLVVVTPHFIQPLAPGENPALPQAPEPFLGPVQEKKGENKQPEYVGPHGHQEP